MSWLVWGHSYIVKCLIKITTVTHNIMISILLFIVSEISVGFLNASYTFPEKVSEYPAVFLHKENQRVTEQVLDICVSITSATPNSEIGSATLKSSLSMDNDYSLLDTNTVIIRRFQPNTQTMRIDFDIYDDQIAEGTEAFQITISPETILLPGFLSPINLFASTFIIILDDDRKLYIQCMYS